MFLPGMQAPVTLISGGAMVRRGESMSSHVDFT
jgi:hypothetical protein